MRRFPVNQTLEKIMWIKYMTNNCLKLKGLRNKFLWVSMDETTDVEGRYIANAVVVILDKDEEMSKSKFLINVIELKKANHATIARACES